MELSRIKNLIKQNGDKFIIVENGEAEMVVMSFGEYSRMVNGGGLAREPDDVSAGAAQGVREETEFVVEEDKRVSEFTEMYPERVRLEDLPI